MSVYLRVLSDDMSDLSLVERICLARGIERHEIAEFLNPTKIYSKTKPEEEFPDIVRAADFLAERIMRKEKILIWGDYDCDGIMASAIIDDLCSGRCERIVHIPERSDGYGINLVALQHLIDEHKPDCMVTVDTGISCAYEIDFARKRNVSVLLTDHHLLVGDMPKPDILVNPILGKSGRYKYMCGAGVAWLLANLVESRLKKKMPGYVKKDNRLWTCYAGIATIADVVPIGKKEDAPGNVNRFLVRKSLEFLEELAMSPEGKSPHNGLQALLTVNGHKQIFVPSSYIAFTIAPAINACGRLTSPKVAFSMIKNKSPKEAAKCMRINGLRKEKTSKIFLDLLGKLNEEKNVIVAENVPVGLVGLLAGRLAEQLGVPIVVLTHSAGSFVGSARAPEGYPLIDFLKECGDLLERYGGHERAAGCSVSEDNLLHFREKFCSLVSDFPKPDSIMAIDAELATSEITMDTYRQLSLLEPFGNGNSYPVFLFRNVAIVNIRRAGVLKEHMLFSFLIDGHMYNGKMWNVPQKYRNLAEGTKYDVIGELTEPFGSRLLPEIRVLEFVPVASEIPILASA